MQLPIILKPPFLHDRAYCWRIRLPDEIIWLADTTKRQIMCPFVLFEDLAPLGPAHRLHADIAAVGAGQFSVWQNGALYFSTSDNTDPNSNGRQYSLDFGEARGVTVGPGPRLGLILSEAVGTLPDEVLRVGTHARIARTTLSALIEPTPSMVDAARAYTNDADKWRAMVKVALSELDGSAS